MKTCIESFLQSGSLNNDLIIKKHIEQQTLIDDLLPGGTSFYYVVEPITHRYHFLGKQQSLVSGYSNEEFLKKGLDLFFQCVHPSELDIIIQHIFPTIVRLIAETEPEKKKELQLQFNYRFIRKDGQSVNLMEQICVLELDKEGKAALILGNVVVLPGKEVLPVCMTGKRIDEDGYTETFFLKSYNSVNKNIPGITVRELEILRNLAVGKTSKGIAKKLFISRHTVDTHRRNLLKKMHCSSVVELANVAFQNGLL